MNNSKTAGSSPSTIDGTIAPEDFEDAPAAEDGTIPAEGFEDAPASTKAPEDAPGDSLLATAEGAARGLLGPAAGWLEEHNPLIVLPEGQALVSKEQQNQRASSNPLASAAGEVAGTLFPAGLGATVSGAVGVAAKMARLERIARLGKIGSAALQGALASGLMQTSDEISQWAQGQGDPQDPVGAALAHIGVAGVLGLGAGAASSAAQTGLKKIADARIGDKAREFAAGLGGAASGAAEDSSTKEFFKGASYNLGKKLYNIILAHPVATVTQGAAGYKMAKGYDEGGLEGAAKAFGKAELIGLTAGIGLKLANRIIAPVAMKAIASEKFNGIVDAAQHMSQAAAGSEALNQSIDYALRGGARAAASKFGRWQDAEALDKDLQDHNVQQQLQQEMYNQAEEPQGFAHGGEVKGVLREPGILEQQAGVAEHYPEQNVLLAAAKGRVSNYLTGLRPAPHQAKLAFDEPADHTQQTRTYHKALAVAANPLGVLEDVQKGTLDSSNVAHFKAMYPETNQLMQKRLAERLTEMQLKGEKPSYRARQGLSLLMGANLSGEVLPSNIVAAQSAFRPSQSPQQSQAPQSRTVRLSSAGREATTPDQARQERQQLGK